MQNPPWDGMIPSNSTGDRLTDNQAGLHSGGSGGQQPRHETGMCYWGDTKPPTGFCWQECGHWGKGNDNSLLPGTHETAPGVQCPVLFPWEWETGESLAESHQDGYGTGVHDIHTHIYPELRELGLFGLLVRRVMGFCVQSFVPKGGLRRRGYFLPEIPSSQV